MSDRLTVIIPPVLSLEERERAALEFCGGSLKAGNGWGDGLGAGHGDGRGDGWGGTVRATCWISDYGDGDGNGRSSARV